MTTTTSPQAGSDHVADGVLDLTDGDYAPARVVHWLRSSAGTIHERMMKCVAADLIESAMLEEDD